MKTLVFTADKLLSEFQKVEIIIEPFNGRQTELVDDDRINSLIRNEDLIDLEYWNFNMTFNKSFVVNSTKIPYIHTEYKEYIDKLKYEFYREISSAIDKLSSKHSLNLITDYKFRFSDQKKIFQVKFMK